MSLNNNVIVFGGTGMVGTALKKIRPEWIYLSSKDGDLRNIKNCAQLFVKHKPNKVIFLAASCGGLYKNLNDNYDMFINNMQMEINIIECCNQFNVKHGIFCLSTCVFPDKVNYPITEEQLHNGPPHSSNYGYAYAKRNMEIMCRLSNETYGSKFYCITPTNIYGENDNFNLENGHVIPALIHKAYLSKKYNKKLILRGSGKALRQFVYSSDVARIIQLLIFNDFPVDNYIISPKEEISIKKIAEIICNHLKLPHDSIYYDTTYSDGQYKKTCDSSKIIKLTNFKYTSFEDGIEKTIEWFNKHYPYIRK